MEIIPTSSVSLLCLLTYWGIRFRYSLFQIACKTASLGLHVYVKFPIPLPYLVLFFDNIVNTFIVLWSTLPFPVT